MRGVILALACLAACAPPQPQSDTPSPSAPPAALVLSPAGYGPVRIGMTPQEASAALGRELIADGGEHPESCETFHLAPEAPLEGLRFLARDGRIARISDHGSSGVVTLDGLAVGSPLSAVRAVFPNAIIEPLDDNAPTTAVTAWNAPGEAGYRFHIADDRVTAITVGDGSILLMEGCS